MMLLQLLLKQDCSKSSSVSPPAPLLLHRLAVEHDSPEAGQQGEGSLHNKRQSCRGWARVSLVTEPLQMEKLKKTTVHYLLVASKDKSLSGLMNSCPQSPVLLALFSLLALLLWCPLFLSLQTRLSLCSM